MAGAEGGSHGEGSEEGDAGSSDAMAIRKNKGEVGEQGRAPSTEVELVPMEGASRAAARPRERGELAGGRRPCKSQGSYGRWSSRPGGRWDRGSAARLQGTRPWGGEQGAPALRELGGHGRPLRAGVLLP
jgi:hypothetical protein